MKARTSAAVIQNLYRTVFKVAFCPIEMAGLRLKLTSLHIRDNGAVYIVSPLIDPVISKSRALEWFMREFSEDDPEYHIPSLEIALADLGVNREGQPLYAMEFVDRSVELAQFGKRGGIEDCIMFGYIPAKLMGARDLQP